MNIASVSRIHQLKQMKLAVATLVLQICTPVSSFAPLGQRSFLASRHGALSAVDPRRETDSRSLGERMFGDVLGGLQKAVNGEPVVEKVVVEQGPLSADRAISEIDARAAKGEITYQDFIAMSRTFAELNGNVPGMPSQLSPKQIAETKAKFAKHEKIVQAMTPEELVDPALMSLDLKDAANKCPRVQRLARESGVAEKDVALFIAEFEATRQSTARIAAGEDPDAVNASLGEGAGNRAARRATSKLQKKAKTEW